MSKDNEKVKQLEAENSQLKKQLEDSNFLLAQYMNQKMQLEQQLMLMSKENQQPQEPAPAEPVQGETVN